MRFSLLLLSLFTFGVSAQSQDRLPPNLNEEWVFFLKPAEILSYSQIPEKLFQADGKEILAQKIKLSGSFIDLAEQTKGNFEEKSAAILYNEFSSERAGVMRIGVSADYWMEIYINGTPVFNTLKSGNAGKPYTPDAFSFDVPIKVGKNLLAVKVLAGADGWRFVYGAPAPHETRPNVRFQPSNEWKAVNMDDLLVKEGSALDLRKVSEVPRPTSLLSRLGLVKAPAKLPRLEVGPTGRIVVEGRPDITVKLHGGGVNTPRIFDKSMKDPEWKELWKREILQARLQGYNILRLSTDAVYPEDMNIRPDQFDKFDYFTSTLAENGGYTFLTVGASGVYLKNAWGPLLQGERRDYKLRMYLGDEQVRKAWKYGVEALMNHVNAYTGVPWKDDPSIACIELFNEQEWGFFYPKSKLAEQTRLEFDTRYRLWLQEKYKTVETLSRAWGMQAPASFESVMTPEEFPFSRREARDNDYILFCAELSRESVAWMRDVLRATGYKGMVAQYNMSHWQAGQEVRWEESQVTIANAYHNHPTAFDNPGSKCGQESSIGAGAWYSRSISCMRFADRPLIVTEYNHSFWNPYQYECGIVFGAYAALNSFDAVFIHEGPVFYYAEKSLVNVFNVGYSPVSRAGEFLLSCLFLRGDVKASPHRVELQIPKEYLETNCNGGRSVSSDQGRIAFMTGFSIAFPWAKRAEGVGTAPQADLVLTPDSGAEFISAGGGWAISGKDSKSTKFSLDAAVARMKEMGLLSQSNISDPSKGIFQSDTGEITMRSRENLIKVVTSRSEAVAMEGNKGESIGLLNVSDTSVPALVATCAVDQKNLDESGRIVLIYSTQVVNNEMELSPDRSTLVNLGKLPVLMRVGRLSASLRNINGAKMSLYALGLDGTRRGKLPVAFVDGTLQIHIDTAALKDGPTPFFELVKE
ncbi:MAG: hypothetical protein B9S32_00850 [Verrucomicrobia bacterium Tous-C9LFEB]|nr:MAG: hypothetical protein B9S32_00850 [Verrucomicrobia bacterium Tous-C9LFEB]